MSFEERNSPKSVSSVMLQKVLAPIIVFTLLVIGIIFYISDIGSKMTERIGSMIDASMEVRSEIGLFHLWFEEMVHGDPIIKAEEVWRHFHAAKRFAKAMIEGGEIEGLQYIPIENHVLQAQVKEFFLHMDELEKIGRQRETHSKTSAIGSDIDQEFDKHFNHVITQTEKIEASLQQTISNDMWRYNILTIVLGGAVVMAAFIMCFVIVRYEKRRESDALNLRETKKEAERANETKTNFLANMSHDFRTPLNAIKGFAEMMETKTFGPLGNAHYEEYAKDIRTSCDYLIGVVNDVLDISKIETGTLQLEEKEVNPTLTLSECLKMVEHQAGVSEKQLSSDFPNSLPFFIADETRVKQILLNILSNAIKFTSEKGRISVSAYLSGNGEIGFQVSDTGVGISPEDIQKVLQPFEQAEDILTRSHEGAGLGLSISNRLVELHGGTLKIDSKVDKGTTVTVLFPPERTVRYCA